MQLILSAYDADKYMPNSFAICLHEGKRPLRGVAGQLDWRLEGAISRLIISGEFKGERDEHTLFYSSARTSKIFIFGAGAKGADSPDEIARRAENIMKVLFKAGETEFVLAADAMMLSFDPNEELKINPLKFMEGLLQANSKMNVDPHITIPCPGDIVMAKEQIKAALDTLGRTGDIELVEQTE